MSVAYPMIQRHNNGPLTKESVSRLFKIREDNALSYADLGKIIGFSGAFTYNLMNKDANVDSKHIGKISKGLELAEAGTLFVEKAPFNDASLSHSFHLRPGLQIELRLPGDLTEKEAARLAQFVQSLPVA